MLFKKKILLNVIICFSCLCVFSNNVFAMYDLIYKNRKNYITTAIEELRHTNNENMNKIINAYKKKKFFKAYKYLQKTTYPLNKYKSFLFAIICIKLEKYDEAQYYLTYGLEYIENDEKNKFYYELLNLYIVLNDTKKGIAISLLLIDIESDLGIVNISNFCNLIFLLRITDEMDDFFRVSEWIKQNKNISRELVVPFYMELALYYMRIREFDKAKLYAKKSLTICNNVLDAYLLLAQINYELGNEEQFEYYMNYVFGKPYKVGDILYGQRVKFGRYVKSTVVMENWLMDAIKIDDQNARFYIMLAEIYEDKEDYSKALYIIGKALKTVLYQDDIIRLMIEEADNFYRIGKKDLAINNLRQVLKDGNYYSHICAYQNLIKIYVENNNIKALIDLCNQMLKKGTMLNFIIDKFMWDYYKSGNINFTKILKGIKHPNSKLMQNIDIYNILIDIRNDKLNSVEKKLKKCIDYDDKELFFIAKALLNEKRLNYDNAKKNYEKALASAGDRKTYIYMKMANIAIMNKQYNDAIEFNLKIIRQFPRDRGALLELKKIYNIIGSKDKADYYDGILNNHKLKDNNDNTNNCPFSGLGMTYLKK